MAMGDKRSLFPFLAENPSEGGNYLHKIQPEEIVAAFVRKKLIAQKEHSNE